MVCVTCVFLARGGVGGVGGEWVTGFGLGFTNSGGIWGKWGLCFGCGGVGGVGGEWVGGLVQGWQISHIQTCLRVVVGPGLVSTSSAFIRRIASHPAGRHGRLAQKR